MRLQGNSNEAARLVVGSMLTIEERDPHVIHTSGNGSLQPLLRR